MASSEWIVPLPPGTKHNGRDAVGVIPCHGKTCDQWALVRLDKVKTPYAPCDKALTVKGCKRRYDLLPEDMPPQTREKFESMRDDLALMPADIRDFVLNAWGELETPEHEEIAKPVAGKSDTKPESAQEHQGEPAGETRDEPADPGRDKPDQAGDVQSDTAEGTGPEPGDDEGELGIFGM